MVTDYINKIAPNHGRTSCDDGNLYNAAYGLDDFDGRGRCYRCTLIAAADSATVVTDEMVETVAMGILGKEKDPTPNVNWRCSRLWNVNDVRELVRKSLNKVFGERT